MHFWLRDEIKPGERRTPLLPEGARELLAEGHKVSVEKSKHRCFTDKEYADAGCEMVESGTWTKSPDDAIILGLKELPEDGSALTHEHVAFGHAYKFQAGWKELLQRFVDGKGKLLDLECLVDDNGRRVAAFGRSAGFVGCGLGLLAWAYQNFEGTMLPGPCSYHEHFESFAEEVKKKLDEVVKKKRLERPQVHVIGALGRVGRGAVELCERVGVKTIKWDMAETAGGGPFPVLLQSEIVVNAILLDASNPPPPFVTKEMLDSAADRKLSVLVDISCDTSNPTNPIPVYHTVTTLEEPALRIVEKSETQKPLDVIAIDHTPTLIPRDSSIEFASAMLPYYKQYRSSSVWQRSLKRFEEKCAEL